MYCRPTACPCASGEPVASKGPRPASTGSRTYHEQQRPVLARRAVPSKERHEKDEDAHHNEGWRPVCPRARVRVSVLVRATARARVGSKGTYTSAESR